MSKRQAAGPRHTTDMLIGDERRFAAKPYQTPKQEITPHVGTTQSSSDTHIQVCADSPASAATTSMV